MSETTSDPCENCGKPVYGYVEQRCCDGRECGCMGRPLEPCWCDECWAAWETRSKEQAAAFAAATTCDDPFTVSAKGEQS